MALPTTNLRQVYHVACTLGETSGGKLVTDLARLCTSSKVNHYARFRPGYWYVDTSGNLTFQVPRGGTQTDPRGNRPDGKGNKEVYALGDFRGYNHDAPSPSLNTGSDTMELTFASDQAGKDVSIEVVFNLGEVDWFNEETQYHGKNYINAGAYDTIYAYRKIGTTSQAMIGSCSKSDLEKSGYTARAPITCTLFCPASGTTAYTLMFGLGYAGKAYAWFPNELTVKLTVLSGAIIIVRVLASALTGLKSKLTLSPSDTGDSPTSLQEVIVYGGEKSYTSAVVSASFTELQFVARMYSGRLYAFSSLRVGATGTVYCYDRPINASGAVLKSQQAFNAAMAASGYGTYTLNVSLPEAANDGEYFYVDISEFTTPVTATQI